MDRTVTKNLVKILGHLNSNVFTCKRNKDVCISIWTGKLCSKWCLRRGILTNLLLLAAISSTFDWHFGKCFWQQKLFLPTQTPYATAAITSNTHQNTLSDNNKTLNVFRQVWTKNVIFDSSYHSADCLRWSEERQEKQFSCYHLSKVWIGNFGFEKV